jgi:hypothetical protein
MTKANPKLLASGTFYVAQSLHGEIVGCGGWTREQPGTGEVVQGEAAYSTFCHSSRLDTPRGRALHYGTMPHRGEGSGYRQAALLLDVGCPEFLHGIRVQNCSILRRADGLNGAVPDHHDAVRVAVSATAAETMAGTGLSFVFHALSGGGKLLFLMARNQWQVG